MNFKFKALFFLFLNLFLFFHFSIQAQDNSNKKNNKIPRRQKTQSETKDNPTSFDEISKLEKEIENLKKEKVDLQKKIESNRFTNIEYNRQKEEFNSIKSENLELKQRLQSKEIDIKNLKKEINSSKVNTTPIDDEKVAPQETQFSNLILYIIIAAVTVGILILLLAWMGWENSKSLKKIAIDIGSAPSDKKKKSSKSNEQMKVIENNLMNIKEQSFTLKRELDKNIQSLKEKIDTKITSENQSLVKRIQQTEEELKAENAYIKNIIGVAEGTNLINELKALEKTLLPHYTNGNIEEIQEFNQAVDLNELRKETEEKQNEIVELNSNLQELLKITGDLGTNDIIQRTEALQHQKQALETQLISVDETINECISLCKRCNIENVELGSAINTIDKVVDQLSGRKEKYKKDAAEAAETITNLQEKINSLTHHAEGKEDLQTKLQQYSAIIPDNIFAVFGHKYPLNNPKICNLFLSLLALNQEKETDSKQEMRTSFMRFDTQLFECFSSDIDKLTDFRNTVLELLNTEILTRFFSVEWPIPGNKFNKEIHIADSEFTNSSIKVARSAILRENDGKLINKANVDTQ